jgi:hypothetical protein
VEWEPVLATVQKQAEKSGRERIPRGGWRWSAFELVFQLATYWPLQFSGQLFIG